MTNLPWLYTKTWKPMLKYPLLGERYKYSILNLCLLSDIPVESLKISQNSTTSHKVLQDGAKSSSSVL